MKKSKEILHKIKTSKLLKIELIVTILELILGTLLHFIYEWSGNNAIIASFSAVNESVWEHLKLVFYPMLILGLIEYYFVKNIQLFCRYMVFFEISFPKSYFLLNLCIEINNIVLKNFCL